MQLTLTLASTRTAAPEPLESGLLALGLALLALGRKVTRRSGA